MSDFEIVTQKRSYTFNVKGCTVGFVGTEIEYGNFHYEGNVPIFLEDENNVVGIVYHKRSEDLFSLDFLSKEKYQAILDAHEHFLKCVRNENIIPSPFDEDLEECIRDFVRNYGLKYNSNHMKFTWEPYHCDATVAQASVLIESDTKKLAIIIQLSKKHKQEIYRYSHMALGIDSNGAVFKKQRDINLIDWRAEFGMV